MKPLATDKRLAPTNGFRYAACFGIRAVAEWFSSDRDGRYHCYPRQPGVQHSQRKKLARYVQERLTVLGYDPGPIDGDLGPRTKDAVKRFQSVAGLTVDGRISSTLLTKLRTARKTAQRRQPPAQEKRLYGSIAFRQGQNDRYAWGMSWNSSSGTKARRGALRACREHAQTCREVANFSNKCAALAVSDGAGFATAGGDTTAAAERAALSKCRDGRTNCRIEVSRVPNPARKLSGYGYPDDNSEQSREGCARNGLNVGVRTECGGYHDSPRRHNCWKELEDKPGCHFWSGSTQAPKSDGRNLLNGWGPVYWTATGLDPVMVVLLMGKER